MIYCVIPQALADELYDKMVAYYKDDPNVTVIIDRRDGPDRSRPPTKAIKAVARVDGAARGTRGPAAIGAVVSDAGGGELLAEGRYIGEATNNVAEYKALLLGLELARSLGATEVKVVNDSELVARQIGGQYKVKHAGLKPLFEQASEALRGFDRWSVESVPRAKNARADELVNEALD